MVTSGPESTPSPILAHPEYCREGLLRSRGTNFIGTRFDGWPSVTSTSRSGLLPMGQDIIAVVVLGCWLYLIAARGGFWLSSVRDDSRHSLQAPTPWPPVIAVVPARNEARSE